MCSAMPCAAIFGLADRGSQSGRGDVSTFRRAQKYIRAPPKRSSKSSPPKSATRITSLLRVAQTFQPATQAQRLGLCPNQDWPRHRPDKLANTRRNLALLLQKAERRQAYFRQPVIGHSSLAVARFSGHTDLYALPCSWMR